MTADDWLPVGKVVAVQGLKGELRINPASEFPERFTEPGTRWLKARGKAPREIELKAAVSCRARACLWCASRASTAATRQKRWWARP